MIGKGAVKRKGIGKGKGRVKVKRKVEDAGVMERRRGAGWKRYRKGRDHGRVMGRGKCMSGVLEIMMFR